MQDIQKTSRRRPAQSLTRHYVHNSADDLLCCDLNTTLILCDWDLLARKMQTCVLGKRKGKFIREATSKEIAETRKNTNNTLRTIVNVTTVEIRLCCKLQQFCCPVYAYV